MDFKPLIYHYDLIALNWSALTWMEFVSQVYIHFEFEFYYIIVSVENRTCTLWQMLHVNECKKCDLVKFLRWEVLAFLEGISSSFAIVFQRGKERFIVVFLKDYIVVIVDFSITWIYCTLYVNKFKMSSMYRQLTTSFMWNSVGICSPPMDFKITDKVPIVII